MGLRLVAGWEFQVRLASSATAKPSCRHVAQVNQAGDKTHEGMRVEIRFAKHSVCWRLRGASAQASPDKSFEPRLKVPRQRTTRGPVRPRSLGARRFAQDTGLASVADAVAALPDWKANETVPKVRFSVAGNSEQPVALAVRPLTAVALKSRRTVGLVEESRLSFPQPLFAVRLLFSRTDSAIHLRCRP